MWFTRMWLYAVVMILYLINVTTGRKPSTQPKIIIIGAGASGIAAASKLYENGFENVTILEAEDRIGGRVYTIRFDNSWIDLGGQWVHGETNNIAYELASPYGLLDVPPPANYSLLSVYNSKGYLIPSSISNYLINLYMDLHEETGEELIGNNGSAGDYYTSRVNTEAANYPSSNETLLKQFIKLFEGFTNSEDGSDNWFNTSARGYVEYWNCPGSNEVNWKDRGYSTILDILVKKYPNPDNELPVVNNTIMNTEVVNINYNSSEGNVLIKSNDGKKYVADHVIVTPSLGVLKEQYATLFTPKLPESKVKTIKGLGMGSVGKFFLSYDEAWWPDDLIGIAFVWNESDKQEYENDPDKKWLLDVIGFFPVEYRPRILMSWITGTGARYMETLPAMQVLDQICELLNKFVGKSYNISEPNDFARTQWYSNKHFRGTYSFRSMESEKTDVWHSDLAKPLLVNGKPIVMFAGEATNTHFYSTVHGAIETGFREAERLIKLYNNTSE